ncbi:MAG: hypothetical protein MUF25_09275 [Pirellulaceae bacterium]|nr:hypothetical protein [Pirellulaceae bacterium]
MGWGMRGIFSGVVVLLVLAGAQSPVAAQTAETELRESFRELERWLGSDANAPGWRKFLKTDQLTAELEKGATADRAVVRTILIRYSSGMSGLERKRFVAVRHALRNWLNELPALRAEQLPEAARAAKQRFVAVTATDVDRERKQLTAVVANLKKFLNAASAEDAARWRESLKWDQLETSLASTDARPDLKSLQSIGELYYQDLAGLERNEFLAVRESLDKYVSVALLASSENSQKVYEGFLDELAEKLAAYQQRPTADQAREIGKRLGWMDRFGQAGELVESTRSCYSRPNLFLEVSEALMQAGIDQNVDETAAVNEVILGTRIRGNARLTGAVTLDLVANDQHAAMDILLNGSTVSDSVGTNGPVRIFSRGFTSVAAKKSLTLDETGISDHPATARCSTRTRIGKVDAGHLVKLIAMKRIQKSTPQAEAIASRRAAGKIASSVDDRSDDLLGDANTTFADKFRLPLVRRGGFPQLMQFRTTDDALQVTMLQAGREQLAAPNTPPALTGKFDLAVRLHESLVGNLSQAVLGGVTLTDVRLAEMIKELTGKVPEELAVTDESEPWSITFTSELPIEARFDAQTVKFLIRGRRFGRGDQEVRRLLEISATYTVEKMPDRARLVRQGDVQIDFLGRASLSASDVAMKSFMKTKFDGLFKPEIVSEGLVLPERWKSIGKLQLQQLGCDQGWLALGWLKPPTAAETQVASNP